MKVHKLQYAINYLKEELKACKIQKGYSLRDERIDCTTNFYSILIDIHDEKIESIEEAIKILESV